MSRSDYTVHTNIAFKFDENAMYDGYDTGKMNSSFGMACVEQVHSRVLDIP